MNNRIVHITIIIIMIIIIMIISFIIRLLPLGDKRKVVIGKLL